MIKRGLGFSSLFFAIFFFPIIVHSYWVQVMPNHELWFRSIQEGKCPMVKVGEQEYQTSVHLRENSEIPLTSCKFILPQKASSVSFKGKIIKLLNQEPKKILIIGDTGCRVKGLYYQNCHDEWPFSQIAELAAKHKPDLIIHVGDYLYREFCRSLECKDQPVGDNLETWQADFFNPAKTLLTEAPWVMVRGNHESCSRGGNGWSHFFDYREKCYDHTEPYTFDISSDLRLIITDSAEGNLTKGDLVKINSLAKDKESWLFTHRPLWAQKTNNIINYIPSGKLSENINTIFSGHIHLFQLSENLGKKQIIAGNSGTSLDKWPEDSSTYSEFGFLLLEKHIHKTWKLNLFNVKNELVASYFIE